MQFHQQCNLFPQRTSGSRFVDPFSKQELSPLFNTKLTSIICTLGPSSCEADIIEKMLTLGMNVACLDLSFGTREFHKRMLANTRIAASSYSRKIGTVYPAAIALQLKGPEVQTGILKKEVGPEIEIHTGDLLKLTTMSDYADVCDHDIVYVNYESMNKVINKGDKIIIDHGKIILEVTDPGDTFITCDVTRGGRLGNQKSINLPGIPIDLPPLLKEDVDDIIWGIGQEIDFIIAPFVRNVECIKDIRNILGIQGNSILILSRIENLQGIENIDEIIKESDGIMFSRGDLGFEIPLEKMFLIQKEIISKCNKVGKPFICAAQLLLSMVNEPEPTQAEITDVANAVLDGTDSVMLMEETSFGYYPSEAITIIAKICKEAEISRWQSPFFYDKIWKISPPLEPTHALAIAAVEAAVKVNAPIIISMTTSGRSAKLLSQYRPQSIILAITRYGHVARQLMLWPCIEPIHYINQPLSDWGKDIERRMQFGITLAKRKGYLNAGDPIVILSSWRTGSGFSNNIRIVYASGIDTLPLLTIPT